MDRFCGSQLQGRRRSSPEKQGHLTRRRELCFSPSRDNEEEGLAVTSPEKWDSDSVRLGVARRRRREDSRRRRSEEILGSQHYKEGDMDFSPVPQKKKSIADSEQRDAAHSPLSVSDAGLSSLKKSGLGSFSATFEGWVLQQFFCLQERPFQKRVLAEVAKIPPWHVVIGRISGLKKGGAEHSEAGFCNIFFCLQERPFQKRVLAEVAKIPPWHVVIGRI